MAAFGERMFFRRNRFACNKDEFTDLRELKRALQNEGLESSNLIFGIDFTNCNQNIVKHSVSGHGSHACNVRYPSARSFMTPNPYEHAITIIGKALVGFDDDNKIPCFGFGDASTRDQKVFNFFQDGAPCHGIEDVLARYRKLLPRISFSEPTSFVPIIYAAIDVVKRSGGLYHILVIIANGQVTSGNHANRGKLRIQEKASIEAIVYASSFPLSIILVGVGDGPWDSMKHFDDALPKRKFDNFQFVNYTEIVAKYQDQKERELACALAALMEIPQQFKAIKQLPLIRQGREKKAIIIPPP